MRFGVQGFSEEGFGLIVIGVQGWTALFRQHVLGGYMGLP